MNKKDKADEALENQAAENESVSKHKMAFFITPVAQPNSDIRRATDGVIDAVLEPILSKHGFRLVAPHRVSVPGSITKQVIRDILQADLVIANLTGLNANVMYELAVRHAKRLPVITIAQKDTALPFDIHAERTIFYTNDMHGVIELIADLDKTIPLAMAEEQPDNPIYSGVESLLIQQESVKENDPVQNYILKQLEELSAAVKTSTTHTRFTEFDKGERTRSTIYSIILKNETMAGFQVKFGSFAKRISTHNPGVYISVEELISIEDGLKVILGISPAPPSKVMNDAIRVAGYEVTSLIQT